MLKKENYIKVLSLFILLTLGITSCEPEVLPEPDVPEVEIPTDTTETADHQTLFELKADTTSSVDQTVFIQKQIDSIPDGEEGCIHTIKLPKGKYWTEGNLENNPRGEDGIINFIDREYLTIEGHSKEDPTIFYTKTPASPYGGDVQKNDFSKRKHIRIHNSDFITLRYIRIEGSNSIEGKLLGTAPEYTPDFWGGGADTGAFNGAHAYEGYWEQEHAIDIRFSRNITVEDFQAVDVWGDGIYVGNHPSQPSEDVVIRDTYIGYPGRQGIGISSAYNVLIDNVFIEKGRRASIDLEPFLGGTVDNVEVRNSRLEAIAVVIAGGGHGYVNNVNIHDNVHKGGALVSAGHRDYPRHNWVIRNNTRENTYGSPSSPLKFYNITNITIENNDQNVVETQSRLALFTKDCGGELIVTGNDFHSGYRVMLRDSKFTTTTIENNSPKLITED